MRSKKNDRIVEFRDVGQDARFFTQKGTIPSTEYSISKGSNFLLGDVSEHSYKELFEKAKDHTGFDDRKLADYLIRALQDHKSDVLQGLNQKAQQYLVKIIAIIQGPEYRRAAINPTASIAALASVVRTNADIYTTLEGGALFVGSGGSRRSQFHRRGSVDQEEAAFKATAEKEYDNIAHLADINGVDTNNDNDMSEFVERITTGGIDALLSYFKFTTKRKGKE